MSPEVNFPGVFIEESSTGRTIPGVSTSVTAFVGAASRGSSYRAVRITSFAEFERRFGGLVASLDLGYAVQQFFLNGGTDAWIVRVARQLDAGRIIKGIRALDAVESFNLLVIPGVMNSGALLAAADYCRQRRAFLIVDAPKSAETPAQMEQALQDATWPITSNGAVYFPWIKIADSADSGALRLSPPSGTVAGLFARTDITRGVWKAPAGTEATLLGVKALAYELTDAENGLLNPRGINCLRSFLGYGLVAWGARTLEGDDQRGSEFKYISVRRLALFVEESISRGTQWAVFEPNALPLWVELRRNVEVFLSDLFRAGAFQGSTPRDAYFVKCDSTTTTQDDIDAGAVNVVIGFAPVKPAEFIIVTIRQAAGRTVP